MIAWLGNSGGALKLDDVAHGLEERPQIWRARRRGLVDSRKVEIGVGVHDEGAKPGGTGKPVGEMLGENTVAGQ